MERPDHDVPCDDDAPVNPSANPTFQSILDGAGFRAGEFLAGGAAGLAALATGRARAARAREPRRPLPFTPGGGVHGGQS